MVNRVHAMAFDLLLLLTGSAHTIRFQHSDALSKRPTLSTPLHLSTLFSYPLYSRPFYSLLSH